MRFDGDLHSNNDGNLSRAAVPHVMDYHYFLYRKKNAGPPLIQSFISDGYMQSDFWQIVLMRVRCIHQIDVLLQHECVRHNSMARRYSIFTDGDCVCVWAFMHVGIRLSLPNVICWRSNERAQKTLSNANKLAHSYILHLVASESSEKWERYIDR